MKIILMSSKESDWAEKTLKHKHINNRGKGFCYEDFRIKKADAKLARDGLRWRVIFCGGKQYYAHGDTLDEAMRNIIDIMIYDLQNVQRSFIETEPS